MITPYKQKRALGLPENALNIEDKKYLSKAESIINNSKIVSTALKNTSIEDQLGPGCFFHKDVNTRWLSKLYLIESVKKNLDKLVVLKQQDENSLLFDDKVIDAINELNASQRELNELITILRCFEKPVKLFQV